MRKEKQISQSSAYSSDESSDENIKQEYKQENIQYDSVKQEVDDSDDGYSPSGPGEPESGYSPGGDDQEWLEFFGPQKLKKSSLFSKSYNL